VNNTEENTICMHVGCGQMSEYIILGLSSSVFGDEVTELYNLLARM
jgi:hypothetical protein